MRFKDDDAVMASLYPEGPNDPRRAVMKTLHQTFSSFCQWCGSTRDVIRVGTRFLVCPFCDEPGNAERLTVEAG